MPSPARAAALVAVVLAAAPAAAQEVIGTPDARTARVDALFSAWDRPDSPGCALGVYQDGAIRYARGYGMADLERRVPITPRSVFDLGSTSKQFTAAAVMLLAQDGALSLDDDVRRWIPELPAYERPVTVRHLLHHTSGLRDYIALLNLGGETTDDVTTAEEALAAIVRQRALNFAPGDEHLYSNSGYFLLSVIAERASGRPLRELARERIFAPLGMERTHVLSDHADVVPDRALAYAPRPGGGLRHDVSRWLQTGDGAVFSTVEELLRWDSNFHEPRVGGSALVAALLEPGRLESGRELQYAGGLMVAPFRGLPSVSHGGAWGGYRAELLRFPEERFSVAVLCNLGSINPQLLARSVAEVFLEDRLEPAPAAPAARAEGAAGPAVALPEARLRERTGTFRSAARALRIVTLEEGRLWISNGQQRFELRPVGEREMEVVGAPVPVRVTVEPAAAGEPRRLVWSAPGQDPAVFAELEPWSPSPAELTALAGAYFSEEVQATYTLAMDGESLVVRRPGAAPMPLRPLARDELGAPGGVTLRLRRGADGAVTAFLLDLGRVRGLEFVRR